MKGILLVALGGGMGAVARFKLTGAVLVHTVGWRFPLGTFLVNVLGCLIAGILLALVEKSAIFTADLRLLLFTGILGGFTTFSAFGVETVGLARRGELGIAALYVLLSVALGLCALYLAVRITEALPPHSA